MTYTGDWKAPWAIRSTEILPTLTSTWTQDHITIPPTYKPFFQCWCTQPGLFVTKKASMMSWRSSKLSGKIVMVSNRNDGSSTWRLEPQSRKWSPRQSLLFHRYRRHTASSAECWQTSLNVLACCLGNGVSFILWRTTWDWELRGYTAYPASFLDKTFPLCFNYTYIRRKEKM